MHGLTNSFVGRRTLEIRVRERGHRDYGRRLYLPGTKTKKKQTSNTVSGSASRVLVTCQK